MIWPFFLCFALVGFLFLAYSLLTSALTIGDLFAYQTMSSLMIVKAWYGLRHYGANTKLLIINLGIQIKWVFDWYFCLAPAALAICGIILLVAWGFAIYDFVRSLLYFARYACLVAFEVITSTTVKTVCFIWTPITTTISFGCPYAIVCVSIYRDFLRRFLNFVSCVPTNKHGGGCWNEGPDADGWPPHRVVNQTINCIGPPIVILKFATSAPLHRLGEFPHGSCGWYTFRIGRTLAPLLGPHAHPPPLALAPTAGVMHMTPPTLPATLTETGRTLDEPVSSASLWTQGQRITSQASLTSTEPSHVIGIPLHEAIPGVYFSPQVISPRDELQQHRSAALHSAAIAAAAATSAATAAASSVARSFAAAYDLPLAGLASVPTGLASCATAPAQPGHASMVDTTSPTDLLQRLRTAGVLTAGELLHGFLPFLACFLAALAVSGPSLRQQDSSAPLPLSPPPPPLSAPRSWPLPARRSVFAPIQVSLALVVVFAAFVAELTTDPTFFLGAAGFVVLVVANLARASPRFVARATTLLAICAPTLRVGDALLRSPADLSRDLDRMTEARLAILALATAVGASLGALPPSALPSTRKLLAAGYFACAATCGAVVFRVRTGDERMPSFHLLHVLAPFLACFLAALAVSGPSLRQQGSSAPLPLSPPPPPLSAPRSWRSVFAPIQVSLALVVVFAAFVAELTTDPTFFLGAAGFVVLVVANLARASPRFVARATTLLVICAPTLRVGDALLRSPADLSRDLDRMTEARLAILALATAVGASLGALPPSALSSTRKLLAAGYFACAATCGAVVFRVRTGDERMPSFHLLHVLAPFLACFLAAQQAATVLQSRD
ncbi:hypothetical protein EMIHUDRAFT_121401 [Emiliania huxleyi CCMP1516]|uniref:Uncharacterized protein n=2 Tax=Emiliania huxleyi TaxID=2903 RepID=A0A0D3I3P0_EMIH1|nr:hypothetical protein EMIHUDRAFT_121401 [Emiliania huxleyi CCMP1516]EOD05875.1 hypothetical protein EMIHUDRAFT_121401 [Emiliania huxleyi CCMP1516]|eukprot:XP_005758304.1 hypothetical protein EMIHUDRAFT_121401 [Emiliania huxleyi CCMP1516]